MGSCAALVLLSSADRGLAGDTPPAPPDAPAPTSAAAPSAELTLATADDAPENNKAEAEAHFRRGRQFIQEKAWSQALAELLHARQLYPSAGAMANAAECLWMLQRYDEALDMVEGLLREFEGKLPTKLQESAERLKTKLADLVGTIELEGVPDGASIVIDGRYRGEFPPSAPLRASAGSRLIRIFKESLDPLNARVDVVGGQRVAVRPKSIVEGGRLSVTEQGGRVLAVFVDDVEVGKTPWEGPLSVGEHTVVLKGAVAPAECQSPEEKANRTFTPIELGTQPVTVPIQLRRLMTLSLAAEELGASIRIEPTPAGASVAIDSVSVGRGTWEGKVRVGAHTIEVAAEGFIAETRPIEIQRGKRVVSAISLQRDPSSPFWRKPPRKNRFIAEASVGAPISQNFGGDVAETCSGTCRRGTGLGGYGAVRGGYELSSGLGFGVSAGYLSITQATTARPLLLTPINLGPIDPTLAPNTGTVDDTITLRGAALGAWAALSLGEQYRFHVRAGAGLVLGRASDVRVGRFFADPSDKEPYAVGPIGASGGASLFFVAPELRGGFQLSEHLELTAGIEVMALLNLSRPAWDAQREVNAEKDGNATFPAEALLGQSLVLVTPSIGARWDF